MGNSKRKRTVLNNIDQEELSFENTLTVFLLNRGRRKLSTIVIIITVIIITVITIIIIIIVIIIIGHGYTFDFGLMHTGLFRTGRTRTPQCKTRSDSQRTLKVQK